MKTPSVNSRIEFQRLSDEHLIGIGLVSAACGLTERAVRWMIASLSAMMHYDDICNRGSLEGPMLGRLDGQGAFDMLIAFYRRRVGNEEKVKEFEKAVGRLDRKFLKRNAILHGFWLREGEHIETFSYKSNKTIEAIPHRYTAKDLKIMADQILSELYEVQGLVDAVVPSKKKPVTV